MPARRSMLASIALAAALLSACATTTTPAPPSPPLTAAPSTSRTTAPQYVALERQLRHLGFRVRSGSFGPDPAGQLMFEVDLDCADGNPVLFGVSDLNATPPRPWANTLVASAPNMLTHGTAEFPVPPTQDQIRADNLCAPDTPNWHGDAARAEAAYSDSFTVVPHSYTENFDGRVGLNRLKVDLDGCPDHVGRWAVLGNTPTSLIFQIPGPNGTTQYEFTADPTDAQVHNLGLCNAQ